MSDATPSADAPEPDAEPTEGEAPEPGAEVEAPATEGEAPAEETPAPEPKADDKPPSLKAAIRMEKKAKALRADAEAKVADVSRREAKLQADVAAWQGQVKAWEAQVQPKLQRLQALERAAQAGDYSTIFEALQIDPKRALDGYAADLQMPDALREELAQLRRERAETRQRQAEEQRRAEEQQRAFAEQQQLWDRVRDVVDAAPDAYATTTRYALEVGANAFVAEAQQIRAQLGGNVSTGRLLQEIERRARVYYGPAVPKTAAPSQVQGPGQPATPAANANKSAGKKPVGVPQRAAAESATDESESLSPEELDRRAAEHLRRLRRAK